MSKKRLDALVHALHPQYSRNQIQTWIQDGLVTVNTKTITKPGAQFVEDTVVELHAEQPRYVSRAGFKLEKALDAFGVDVTDLVALDAGLSTGGFTDCLLQRGVHKVYGVDVGRAQVHEKIQNNPHVVVMEQTNLRTLASVGELVGIITLDLSFISVLKVMESVVQLLKPAGTLIVLIKPQFEAGKEHVGKGGIIKDEAIHKQVITTVTAGIESYGFTPCGITESPLLGGSGNKEFLACFKKN